MKFVMRLQKFASVLTDVELNRCKCSIVNHLAIIFLPILKISILCVSFASACS